MSNPSARASSVPAVALEHHSLKRVLELDSDRFGPPLVWALIAAVAVHIGGAAQAYAVGNGASRWARDMRQSVATLLRTEYEVDLVKPPPPPPPPPEEHEETPAPAPAPKAPVPTVKTAAPVNEPPPAAAQAGKILTQEPNPDEPVDLTGEGFVTGNADSYAGGVTANNGTSAAPVRNPNASPAGVVGGTGKAPVAVAPTEDRSRPAGLAGSKNWDCPFPPEADAEQIEFQVVPIVVTIRPDGRPQTVRVLTDPGHGFARAARDCAMRQPFSPALDREGRPMTASLTFNVRFSRD